MTGFLRDRPRVHMYDDWVARQLELLEFLDVGECPDAATFPSAPYRLGLAYARHLQDGQLMYWAACDQCQHTDLFFVASLLRGEHCIVCTDSGLFSKEFSGNEMSALVNRKPARMYAIRRQREACAAMMLDGIDAVRAIALHEAGVDDQAR